MEKAQQKLDFFDSLRLPRVGQPEYGIEITGCCKRFWR